MLKRNLVRIGFLSPLLLLLFPVVTAMKAEPESSFKKPLYINWQLVESSDHSPVFDSSGNLLSAENRSASDPVIALNRHVSQFVKSFIVKEDESLQKTKKRSASYFKIMDEVFSKYELPLELKYLAVIESDLEPSARSRVGARGIWQFMPGTAKDLGLKITKKYDERTYSYKSTLAAAKYLKDLYSQFNDWLLVIAAYNCGPAPICQAMKRSGSKSFWVIQYYLPRESRAHVKRFIGTHYYFEGKGSLVTMTKSETGKYLKELEVFKASGPAREAKKTVLL